VKSPTFFLRINGLAATRTFAGRNTDRYLNRCIANRPEAVIDLVQVDPEDGRELCSSCVYWPRL